MPVLLSVPSLKLAIRVSPFSASQNSSFALAASPRSHSELKTYLGWILIRKCWITPAQLEEALQLQQSTAARLGELLMQRSLLTPEQLEIALREQFWRRNGYWVI